MAMESEGSRRLHNFKLPSLKWGKQKYLLCKKVNADGSDVSGGRDRRSPVSILENERAVRKRREPEMERRDCSNVKRFSVVISTAAIKKSSNDDDGIQAVGEKLLSDLRTAADKIKSAIFSKDVAVEGVVEAKQNDDSAEWEATAPPALAVSSVEERPWDLRTKRAACKAPIDSGGRGGGSSKTLKIDEKEPNHNSQQPRTESRPKSSLLRTGSEKKERAKFAVSLSKKEIEEDFMAMLGHRPPRRPKKRPRNVQKQLDTLFPGLWLTEVTADLYKVEFSENKKR